MDEQEEQALNNLRNRPTGPYSFDIRPRDTSPALEQNNNGNNQDFEPNIEQDINANNNSENSDNNNDGENLPVHNNQPELFTSPEIVYEDPRIKIVVKRKNFEHQKRFRLLDLLFDIKIITKKWRKKRKAPLILRILESLHKALTKILKRIQDVYGSSEHRQLYVTVIEKDISNGLNSGNYSIQTDPSIIAYTVLNSLYYYCQVSTKTLHIYIYIYLN